MTPPDFDVAAAHRFFAGHCFNAAWRLIDKPDRSPADDEQMLWLTLASLWHWTQRADCLPRNLSIGYWQVSRVYALLHREDDAQHYAELCLASTPADDALLLGYAHEALARASILAGDRSAAAVHLAKARELAMNVADVDDRRALQLDLQALQNE